MSQNLAAADEPETAAETPWLRRFPFRSPTLPPAQHTNTYLLGEGELLLVDPGTPDRRENDRLLAELARLRGVGQRVTGIFLTHHHHDHVSGTSYLREQLEVPVLAHALTAERTRARGISVDRLVAANETLAYGPAGFTALFTPGHAPGHLCLRDEAGDGLIAGDMVASVGTILVHPADDGDMAVYLASLAWLVEHAQAARSPLRLWPAHGASVADGLSLLRTYIAHRLMREAKVLAALERGSGTLSGLVPFAYDDKPGVDVNLAGLALEAHLLKLLAEGKAREKDGVWARVY